MDYNKLPKMNPEPKEYNDIGAKEPEWKSWWNSFLYLLWIKKTNPAKGFPWKGTLILLIIGAIIKVSTSPQVWR